MKASENAPRRPPKRGGQVPRAFILALAEPGVFEFGVMLGTGMMTLNNATSKS